VLETDLGRFRIMGFFEGLSLIILLFIAMPLKYLAGIPEVVTIVGSLHGILFVAYFLLCVYTTYKIRWSYLWFISAVVAAFIPFGNLILDRRIKQTFDYGHDLPLPPAQQ
jgi:integral membrane protein